MGQAPGGAVYLLGQGSWQSAKLSADSFPVVTAGDCAFSITDVAVLTAKVAQMEAAHLVVSGVLSEFAFNKIWALVSLWTRCPVDLTI